MDGGQALDQKIFWDYWKGTFCRFLGSTRTFHHSTGGAMDCPDQLKIYAFRQIAYEFFLAIVNLGGKM